jgi:hypothetical protein
MDKREEKEKIKNMNGTLIRITVTTKLNYNSPGSDKLPNYWLKVFPSSQVYIMKIFNTTIEQPKHMTDWPTKGITYQLPKSEDVKE